MAERGIHNPEAGCSNQPPATNKEVAMAETKRQPFMYPPPAGPKSPTQQTAFMPKPAQSKRPGGGALGKPVAKRFGKRGS